MMASEDLFKSLPFLSPELLGSIAFKSSQPGPVQPGGEPPPEPSIQDTLSGLLQPVPEPKGIHFSRAITAAIADALMAKARVLSGGGPGEGDASNQLLAEQQQQEGQKQQVQAENRQVRILQAKEAIEGQKAEEKAKRDADLAAEKEALRLQANMAQKSFEDQIADKNEALRIYSDLVKEPGFKSPPQLDLTKLTKEGALRLKADYFSALTGDEQAGRVLAVMDEVSKKAGPGMETTGTVPVAGGGSVTVKPEAKEKAGTGQMRMLTPSEMLSYGKLGVLPFDDNGKPKTPAQLQTEIAAAAEKQNAEKRAAQDKRLQSRVKSTGGTILDRLAGLMMINETASETLAVLGNPYAKNDPGGPLAGFKAFGLRPDFTKTTDQVKMERLFAKINNRIIKAQAGTAVSQSEGLRLIPEIPQITDTWTTKYIKTKGIIEDTDREIKLLIDLLPNGLDQETIDLARQHMKKMVGKEDDGSEPGATITPVPSNPDKHVLMDIN